ncbi:MAG TPA: HAMP domain-containing sensor histidine kinase [Nitriliruptorales bacterium]
MDETFWPVAVVTIAYTGLGLAAIRRAGKHGHRASARLAAVFASLGAIGAAFVVSDVVATVHSLERALMLVGFLGLLGYPTVLLWFVDALEPVPARARVAVGGLGAGLGGVLAWRLGGGEVPGPASVSIEVLLVVFTTVWALTHLIAARCLWRIGGGLGSVLARRRAMAMVAGMAGLGGVFAVPLVVPGFDARASVGLGVLSAVCVWLGFAPPRIVRLAWSLPDVAAFEAAEVKLLETGDLDVVTRDLLPAVGRLLDGSAAWMTDGDVLVAVHGERPAQLENVHALLGHGATSRDIETVNVGGGRWLIAAPTGSGWLVVRTSDEPVLFGTPQATGLRALAIRTNLLIRRTELELRERETDRRLRDARHLEDIGRLKDDVLSTLSHELRTPLVTIQGASETLAARWDAFDDDQRRYLVGRIDANARDLHELVLDTLRLASVRAENATAAHRPHVVGDLVAAASAAHTPEQRARLQVIGMHHVIETDDQQLISVLRHLLSNAMKFSTEHVLVRGLRHDTELTIEVVDFGPGIPPAELRKVAEPMFRSGDVLHRTTRGLGIGLTLAVGLTEMLGGRLDVRSEAGSGTTASVTLPIRAGQVADVDAPERTA